MTHSYADVEEARQHGLAQGHAKLFGFPVPMTQPFRRYALPQGFLISTARDMTHYLRAMYNGGVYSDSRVLSADGVRAMHTKGPRIQGSAYGFGSFAWPY
jgi:CubicO group peptidase (beta-lactamase class C family)